MIEKSILQTLPVWQQMKSIELSEMGKVKLMNRMDTKYVASVQLLEPLLQACVSDYQVQVVEGSPVASYDSLYFDTPSLVMYRRHHDQFLNRQKIRTRQYLDSSLSFLEVKNKTNKGRTKKKRIVITNEDFTDFSHNQAALAFLQGYSRYASEDLLPQLHTLFERITLVNKEKSERITIDLNVHFKQVQNGNEADLSKVMIIEVKQNGYLPSKMKQILRDLHILPYRVSKYCIGTILTQPGVKYNRFKKKLIYLQKLAR